jgi:hypothetical protein
MSEHSDLDLFIVSVPQADSSPGLSRLDAIRLEASLIDASEDAGFPPFSGDGEYLVHQDLQDILGHLGTREDDYANYFTARMLLLLESKPIAGEVVYDEVIGRVVTSYWRDHWRHPADFLPVFLINDIMRFWKTLCLVYESKTNLKDLEMELTDLELSKRRLRNYKLKFSRLLTCYSAITYMLSKCGTAGVVTPEDAMEMAKLVPTERIELVGVNTPGTEAIVSELLSLYATFLEVTGAGEAAMLELFRDQEFKDERNGDAKRFGDTLYQLINKVGATSDPASELLRFLVV